jgi:hypothetical protein
VLGPAAFVAAWGVSGARADRYDPTREAISRLAALGAPTRPVMTAGLVALGAGMALYGLAIRPHPTWPLAVANGATALAVAALPLAGSVDTAHGVVATLGYLTLAAIPVVAARGVRPAWAGLSVAVGALSGACLLASALVDRAGLFQRIGLTTTHLWIVISSLSLLRSPRSWSTIVPVRGSAGPRR